MASSRDGEADGNGADLMHASELKPLLNMSKRQPVSCVIALTRDKTALIVLDKRVKPRKLATQMKRDAAGQKLELDANSVRFGRAAIDGQGGASLVLFTLNKPPPGGMHQRLLAKIKPAGFQKCDFAVDESVETEAEEDGQTASNSPATKARTQAPDASGQSARTGRNASMAAKPDNASPDAGNAGGPSGEVNGQGSSPMGAVGQGSSGAGSDDGPAGNATNGLVPNGRAAPAVLDRLSLTKRLAGLVKQMQGASDPAARTPMVQAAQAAQTAMKSGDLAAASQQADKLEALLGGSVAPGAEPTGEPAQAGPSRPSASSKPSQSDSAASRSAANSNAPTAAMRQGSPLFERGRQSWLAVRTSIERDIEAVIKGLEKYVGSGSEDAKVIRANFEPILKELDSSLASKLEEIAKNSDNAAHGKLAGEAQSIIGRYKAYVDGEPMVTMLDDNPVHPVTVRKTLDAALATLSKVVGTDAGGATETPAQDRRFSVAERM